MIPIASRFLKTLERPTFPAMLGILLVLSGCPGSGTPDGMPKLYPCKLTVSMENAPLEGASVTLHPVVAGSDSHTAGGTTDTRGNVEIMTGGKYKGVPPGKYKVTVTKTKLVFDPGFEPENIKITPSGDEVQDRKARFLIAQNHSKHLSLVDPLVSKIESSPLEIEITTGKNQFTLDVDPPSTEKP